MEPGEDIIDVLYRYQFESANGDTAALPLSADNGVAETEEQWEWQGDGIYENQHFQEFLKHRDVPLSPQEQSYNNTLGQEGQTNNYQQQKRRFLLEEEPIYVPRSIKADIIFKNDDYFIRRRHPNETLVELASGAFQKKVTMPLTSSQDSQSNGLRKRLTRQPGKEGKSIGDTPNHAGSQAEMAAKVNFKRQLMTKANTCFGIVVMLVISYKYSLYLNQLHENDMWFSEITEVEREISFRTEQGLYYSYFKQLISADSFQDGIRQLINDNKTESTKTINIIQRFNVYQEIILSIIYNLFKPDMKPILFYVDGVFSLQVVYYSALYLISWSLTGTWMSGVLALVYASMNRGDVTRITYTVPLREHFSLPFIFLQFYITGLYLKKQPSNSNLYPTIICVLTTLYTLTWQFAQFVSLLQVCVLFSLAAMNMVNKEKVVKVLMAVMMSMVVVWILQMYPRLVLISLVASFLPIAIVSLKWTVNPAGKGLFGFLLRATLHILTTLTASIALNTAVKSILAESSDNHIFKYVMNKIYPDETDFETRLYICNTAFNWLDTDTYIRLCDTSVLPLYLAFVALCAISYITQIYKSCQVDSKKTDDDTINVYENDESSNEPPFSLSNRPDLCFHVCMSIILGLLAMSTLRMKCFWTPYLCVLASVAATDPQLWNIFSSKVLSPSIKRFSPLLKYVTVGSLIIYLGRKQLLVIEEELSELREFYDPDTVDLMHWIQVNSDPDDVITGSMQLMAGVKLCTGRTIANHPHFEDKSLRDRTRELYQFYGKVSPEEVYTNLLKYNVNYMILEDSICYSSHQRCGTVDTVDLANWHIPEDGLQNPTFLVQSEYPRFCDEVRYDTPDYRQFFKTVFENKTFRIYQVIKKHL